MADDEQNEDTPTPGNRQPRGPSNIWIWIVVFIVVLIIVWFMDSGRLFGALI